MKKLVMTAAVLTCAASIVSAQTVTSANVVGYNKAVTVAGLQILGTQFVNTNSTPEGLFGESLPVGSRVYAFNGVGYDIAEFQSGFGGVTFWDATFDIGQSVGYWVEVPSGTQTNIISGEVELADSVTNSISIGLQILSYPYPVDVTVETLGFVPSVGDRVYSFNGVGYDIAEFQSGFGGVTFWDSNFTLPVGSGWWYESVANATWVATRPFTP